MTIRSGGRPRDRRAHAGRARTTPTPTRPRSIPEYSEPVRADGAAAADGGRGGQASSGSSSSWSSRSSWPAIVLAVALTVLRPVVADAIMSIAEDNPAALQLPFVKDIVARGPRRRR